MFQFLFSYVNMSKDSLAKYYQNNKDRLQKEVVKDNEVFVEKRRKKGNKSSSVIQKSI